MAKCNKALARSIGQDKLKDTAQVFFNISEDIDACAKINTKRFKEVSGNSYYSKLQVPTDALQACDSFGCKNTGTLFIQSTSTQLNDGQGFQKEVRATFAKAMNALDIYAGIIYFYVNVPKAGTYHLDLLIGSIRENKLTPDNGDSMSYTLVADKAGFYPVSIDLAQYQGTNRVGKWIADEDGVQIAIRAMVVEDTDGAEYIGISSISLFEDITDFEGYETVSLTCLTGIDGTDSLSTLEDACDSAGYDETGVEITRDVTARKWSANALKLNPLIKKSAREQGFYMTTKEFVVKGVKDESASRQLGTDIYTNGYVQISDLYVEECGFVQVSLAEGCDVTDAMFTRISNPNSLQLNERQFQVMTVKTAPDVKYDGGRVYFSRELVGQKVIISYPVGAEAVVYTASNDGLNDRKVSMVYPTMRSDGTMVNAIFRNVYITSFPKSLSNSDSEFQFSITIKRDNNGYWYEEQVISKAEQQ